MIDRNNFKQSCIADGDCLIWNKGFVNGKYPIFYISKKQILVKRFLYESIMGIIPNNNIHVYSACGNHRCVNPEHLELKKAAGDAAKANKKYTKEEYRKKQLSYKRQLVERQHADGTRIPKDEFHKKRRERTHCKHGHSLSDCIIKKVGKYKVRVCRTCHNNYNNKAKP